MYIRRKLYSNIEGEMVPVEKTVLFSAKDDAKGAAIGAAGVAGTVGLVDSGLYGAGRLERKLAKGRVLKAKSEIDNILKEAREKADSEAKKWAGKAGVQRDMVKRALDSGKAKASNVGISEAGKLEKGLAAIAKGGATATKWVKNNPKLAALAAAGTITTGAGLGAGISHLKGKKNEGEKVYSVLMTEEQLRVFSEIVNDAATGAGIGTGVALTAGGAALAGNKIGNLAKKTKESVKASRKLALSKANEAGEAARKNLKVANGLSKGNKAYDKAKKEAEKELDKIYKKINKLSKDGQLEKGLEKLAKGGASATKWVKNNPKLAATIAAGTIATGAGIGAGVGAIDNKK